MCCGFSGQSKHKTPCQKPQDPMPVVLEHSVLIGRDLQCLELRFMCVLWKFTRG